jgi:hypothetical protein
MGRACDVVLSARGPLGRRDPRLQRVWLQRVVEGDVDIGRRALGAVAGGEHDCLGDQRAGASKPAVSGREAHKPDVLVHGVYLAPVIARPGTATTRPATQVASASVTRSAFRVMEVPSLSVPVLAHDSHPVRAVWWKAPADLTPCHPRLAQVDRGP